MKIQSAYQHNIEGDEERDVVLDIRNTPVDGASVIRSVAQIIFGELYPLKKFSLGRYDFICDGYIDDTPVGTTGGGIRLCFMTPACDRYNAPEEMLMLESHAGNGVIVRLSAETSCFEDLEQVLKIRMYVKQRDMSLLPERAREIVREQQRQILTLEKRAKECIDRAIRNAIFYLHGEKVEIKHGGVKEKLDFALSQAVESVFYRLGLINIFAENDADILEVLHGEPRQTERMLINNEDALNEVSRWLELQNKSHTPTSMGDVLRRYGGIPYGWRQIDVAVLVARLIAGQKISVRHGGAIVAEDDPRLPDCLRRKSEVDKTVITWRTASSEDLMRRAAVFLSEYMGAVDIPADEDGLIRFILHAFEQRSAHYKDLIDNEYSRERYPQKEIVTAARGLINDILSQRRDNAALLTRLLQKQDDLKNSARDMEEVETFFRTQKDIFDAALKLRSTLQNESAYFAGDAGASGKMEEISSILESPGPCGRIKDLADLTQSVRAAYDRLLDQKKEEVRGIIVRCMGDIHTLAGTAGRLREQIRNADGYFTKKKQEIADAASLTALDAMIIRLLDFRDAECRKIEAILQVVPPEDGEKSKKIVTVRRYDIFPSRRLQSREDIDQYAEFVRKKLCENLADNDGIQIN